jgi:hypothetical protein
MNATTATTGRAATPAGNGSETAPPALRRQTMQAIVQDTYGAADVWRVEQIARPEIAGNEVLVKVHAAGLDRGTWHIMAGELTPGHRQDLPAAPGAWRHVSPRSGTRPGKARHHGDRRRMSRRESVFAVRERARA